MAISTIQPITTEQLRAKGVQALSDRPNARNSFGQSGLNAADLKKWFDQVPDILRQKVNTIIEILQDPDATKYIAYAFYNEEPLFTVTSLYELIESFKDGNLAKHILKLHPNAAALDTLKTLQSIIDSIAEDIANNTDDIENLEDGSAALDQISFTVSDQNILNVVFKNKDGDNSNAASFQIDLNVGTSKLDGSAVTTGKIADGAVTSAKIATDGVQTGNIKDENVTSGKIATGAVTTAKIADANVTTAKIADGAITAAKVAAGAIAETLLASGVTTKLNAGIKTVAFNGSTGVLTFTDNAGNTQTVDLPTELIVSSGAYDSTPGSEAIVLTLANGSVITIPITALVTDLLDEIEDEVEDAEAYAVGTRSGVAVSSDDVTYHNNSKYYSEQASSNATAAANAAIATAIQTFISSTLASAYDSTKTYAVGDLLTYNSKLYQCKADALAGTLPTNTTYFEVVSFADVIEDLPITYCPTTTNGNYVFQATVNNGSVSYGWMDVYGDILDTQYGG